MDASQPIFRIITRSIQPNDPHSASLIADAQALGIQNVERLECADLYFIQGQLSESELQRLAQQLLHDPVTQRIEWKRLDGQDANGQASASSGLIEVALRLGVTDPVAEQIVRAAHEIGIAGLQQAATGQQYTLLGDLQEADLHRLAQRLLANPVTQRYTLGKIDPIFPQTAAASGQVEVLPIRALDDAGLLACSAGRLAALDLAEMGAIQAYFRAAGRDPTDVEFEMLAQTWSEHCVHKTFKACIQVETPEPSPYPSRVDNLLDTYIRRATEEIASPWVISAFEDNAGIVAFGPGYEVSFKVETHNHPSAIEPFGGANTGVGGVIRDILGVSAKPIAATDVLCFGPQDTPLNEIPDGVLHPRRILSGVVAGVQDYGNKLGIPTVNGAVWFDPGYTANPLVYCGCVGIAPRGLHRNTSQVGDAVIVIGGRTGRDGMRGATFSSQTMDAQTGDVSGASVQIGAPITEKNVMEVLLRARDAGLYHAVTDCGAGGLSSAIGEMASPLGAEVDLARVPLKYPGLAPWEIWLSEAQERMVFAVPPAKRSEMQALCDLFGVEMTELGTFTGSGRLVVRNAQKPVLDLAIAFLHHGRPQRQLKARPPAHPPLPQASTSLPDFSSALLSLLTHPNVASKEAIIRQYDHEVQGGTCVKPLVGPGMGPSDACVLKPSGTPGYAGIVLANGFNPEYGKVDPYRMAWCTVDEAVRNAVAAGADPDHMALLDNFCWGDPQRPELMWSLLEAARGCYEAAVAHRTPFISGKDSFNNEYLTCSGTHQAIPPSLLISTLAILPDVRQAVTMDLKLPGAALYLIGEFQPTFGGSHFVHLYGLPGGELASVPLPGAQAPVVYRALHRVMQVPGLVRACHDLSEGGLATAAAEMCIAGCLGLTLDLPVDVDAYLGLFGETAGCLLVEVDCGRVAEFEHELAGLPMRPVGHVTAQPAFTALHAGQPFFSLSIADLAAAWQTSLS